MEIVSGSYRHLSSLYELRTAACTIVAVSSGPAMQPLLLVLMKATRSSMEEFTISSFVVNSVRTASAVAPYLFEKDVLHYEVKRIH